MKALLVMAALSCAQPAIAQEKIFCLSLDKMVVALSKGKGEHLLTVGMMPNGNLLSQFVNLENETFTVTATRPDGMTCIMADGVSFSMVVTTPIGEPL